MRPQRSKTVGTLFPVPQLMRTGHAGAAFAWAAVGILGFTLIVVGMVLEVTVGGASPAAPLVIGFLAAFAFPIGSTVHARRAVARWNAAADEQNRQSQADAVARGIRAEREQG